MIDEKNYSETKNDLINAIQEYISKHDKEEQKIKIDKYRILNEHVVKGQILFIGSSLMEHFPINELLMTSRSNTIIYNRGVGGFTTDDILKNMDVQIFDLEPTKIFINIGTNDIARFDEPFEDVLSHMLENYDRILKQIQNRLPDAEVYVMAYYPVNESATSQIIPEGEWRELLFKNRNNHNISQANFDVKKLAEKYGYHYIDVNKGLTDEEGQLKKEYTVEGIHMYANAYRIIYENMKVFL